MACSSSSQRQTEFTNAMVSTQPQEADEGRSKKQSVVVCSGCSTEFSVKSNGWLDPERCDVCGCDITQKKEREEKILDADRISNESFRRHRLQLGNKARTSSK